MAGKRQFCIPAMFMIIAESNFSSIDKCHLLSSTSSMFFRNQYSTKKRSTLTSRNDLYFVFRLRQVECLHKKDRHRISLDHRVGTIIPATASARNRIRNQLFNVVCSEGTHWNIREDARRCGWDKCNSMFGADKEDRHLRAGYSLGWTIVPAAASAGDSFSG
jgi:hypothetical protein